MTMREDPPPYAKLVETRPKGRPAVWDEHLAGAIADPGHWYKVVGDFERSYMRRVAAAVQDRADGKPRSKHYPKLPKGEWRLRYAHVRGNVHRVEIWAYLVPGTSNFGSTA